jgi:hypothetical protein
LLEDDIQKVKDTKDRVKFEGDDFVKKEKNKREALRDRLNE